MTWYPIKAYLRHWLNLVDEHSIHSPFFFDFYNQVVKGKTDSLEFEKIEKVRTHLLGNDTIVSVSDQGAGSKTLPEGKRTLADIARVSCSPREVAEFYSRLIHYIEARRIVELGSCLGITTLYLAQKKDTEVFTFEGSHALANVSLTNFEYFDQKNIHLIEGNIDSTLPDFLQTPAKLSFVLMDANHRYEPTMKYFSIMARRLNEKSVVVVDDIHWSEDMERAWGELRLHPLVYGSVDLFRFGILFLTRRLTASISFGHLVDTNPYF